MRTKRKSFDLGLILGIAGTVVSVASLLIAVRANSRSDLANQLAAEANVLAREDIRLATMPRVAFAQAFVPTTVYPACGLYLINSGPGIALLEEYSVYVDGNLIREGWERAVELLGLSDLPGYRYSTLGRSLPAGHEFQVLMIGLESQEVMPDHRNRLAQAISRLRIEITYRSANGEAFVALLESRK